MRRNLIFLLLGLVVLPLAVSAHPQMGMGSSLTDQQVLGRRIFRQRCAVCHTPPTPGARLYGPALYKELIVGNEDTIRQFIMNGSKGRMPGFKYGLEPAEIGAIVEFLKTVPKPAPPKPAGSEGPAVD